LFLKRLFLSNKRNTTCRETLSLKLFFFYQKGEKMEVVIMKVLIKREFNFIKLTDVEEAI